MFKIFWVIVGPARRPPSTHDTDSRFGDRRG